MCYRRKTSVSSKAKKSKVEIFDVLDSLYLFLSISWSETLSFEEEKNKIIKSKSLAELYGSGESRKIFEFFFLFLSDRD
nr:hypothetical protein CFP56_13907 [Quercus suber]